MRVYFQLFFGLLIPLSVLFIVSTVLYLKIEYDFTNAMRLGVLAGFFLAIAVSLFIALFLLIIRQGTQPKKDIFRGARNRKKRLIQNDKTNNAADDTHLKTTEIENTSKTSTATQKIIPLLMDKHIAFEVLIYTIVNQKLGQLAKTKASEGYILLKTDKSIIKITISSLTPQTSQMQINSGFDDTENIQKIITHMKEKEYYFTQD